MGEVGRGLIELSRIIMQEAGIFKIEFSLGTLGTFGMGKSIELACHAEIYICGCIYV